MQYTFEVINKESLLKLYSEFGFRAKDIGFIVGVSEDAILKRLQQYDISTNPRTKEKLSVDVFFLGKKKDKRKNLSDEELLRLCKEGQTDAAIGKLFNLTGEGVAYRRKKIGFEVSDKFNETDQLVEKLNKIDNCILAYDYYNLSQKNFSLKYGVSKTLWRPILKKRGILNKSEYRIIKYPPITEEQNILIIGSLLGDGSVSGGNFFYEYHSRKQEQYLRRKSRILQPYTARVTEDKVDDGYRLSTVHHPNFRIYFNLFYEKGVDGKLIPLEFIKKNWHDHILAYWFFDDGYYDDENNAFTIANKCPYPEQAIELVAFLESVYHWGFKCKIGTGVYWISFSKAFYEPFVEILFQIITPDLYYKIPEQFLSPDMALLAIETTDRICPKFYRKIESPIEKLKLESKLITELSSRSFPYSVYTQERVFYLFQIFKNHGGFNLKNNIIESSTLGMDLCETFFPNIYEARRKGNKSPVELWGDPLFRQRLALNRLNHASRLTDSSLRTGIKLLTKTVSNFKPAIAKFLYQKYALNGRVFDYSCGFGSRMLAAMSLDMEYVGCEPNLKTFDNLNKFGGFLKEKTKGNFFVTDKGSEETVYKRNYFSFAFSSPPFFDYEIYSQDLGQSIIKFPVYEDWIFKYWKKTIENSFQAVIPGGYFGVCVSINKHEHIIKSTKDFCTEIGLKLVEEYKAPYKQLFQDNKDKYDLISIFKKGE
jgi:hypothetical protein